MTIQILPQSVLAEEPANTVSEKYSFVPTTTVLEDLAKYGWNPHSAVEVKARKDDRIGKQKHMIRLRNEEISKDSIVKIGDSIPEIVLTNSHDGMASFQLHAGLFRLVCSNGMVIADETFSRIKIKHQGYSMEDITHACHNYMRALPEIIDSVSEFKSIQLTERQKLDFANQAKILRWDETYAPVEGHQLLQVRRSADYSNDLWSVLNVIQENLMRGGLKGIGRTKNKRGQTKPTTTREVKNIDLTMSLNKGLWQLAENFKLN